jgi:hypothetical protein
MKTEDATNPEEGVVGIPLVGVEEDVGMPIEAEAEFEGEAQPEGLDLDGDGEVDIEHDGTTYRVPAALKDSFLRNADYTQKTQALAKDRRALESRDAAARQHVREYARLIALNDQIQAYETVDWAHFQQADPQGAQQQWRNLALLKEKRAGIAEDFQHREQLRALDQQRERARLVEEGHAALARELPEWTQDMARKIVDFGANKYGFTADEIAGIVDPRMVCVLHDAMCRHHDGAKRTKIAEIEAAQKIRPAQELRAGGATTPRDPSKMTIAQYHAWRNG